MRRKSIILMVITVAVVLLCAILFIAHRPILLAIGDFLVVEDELQPADLIHVLSSGDQRTDHAVQLYKQGYGKQIFFTGGWCPDIDGIHAEIGRDRALAQGVPPDDIVIDGSSVSSTHSEAVRLQEFIANSQVPIRSVILVSDPSHMRRVDRTFREALDEQVSLQLAPVPFDSSPYRRQWWTDGGSRRMVMQEYLKIAYYFVRYDLSWGPVQE
jgi:uncharacterized SAM-binding protein YcdF (DUF218 family)